jgi:hypothetical protein
VDPQGAPHDIDHELAWVQRGERVLEHDLAVPAVPAPRVLRHAIDPVSGGERLHLGIMLGPAVGRIDRSENVEALDRGIVHAEVHATCRRRHQSRDASPQGGLAASALSHEAHRRASRDVEADAIDRSHVAGHPLENAFADREVLREVAHVDHIAAGSSGQRLGGQGGDRAHRPIAASCGMSAGSTPSAAASS